VSNNYKKEIIVALIGLVLVLLPLGILSTMDATERQPSSAIRTVQETRGSIVNFNNGTIAITLVKTS
jgi:hypothetical protein